MRGNCHFPKVKPVAARVDNVMAWAGSQAQPLGGNGDSLVSRTKTLKVSSVWAAAPSRLIRAAARALCLLD